MIPRPDYLKQLIAQKDRDLIKVVTGVRRCGKSVLLMNLYIEWLREQGVAANHIIKVDLELKDNEKLRNADALYSYVTGQLDDGGIYYVLIDEVQYVDDFADVLNSHS